MKKAFTLIELLVVIAIIAILAAILFPVFASAKESARKTSCLNNSKQIATALYSYTIDNDDMPPQTSWESELTRQPFNQGGKYQIHWTYLLQPYVKNWAIFTCPSDTKVVTPKYPCPNGEADLGKLNSGGQMYCDWMAQKYSYIPNYNLIPAHDWTPVAMSQFPDPSNTIMTTERRNALANGTVLGKHKGLSGFNPSQPCPGSQKIAPQYDKISGLFYAYWTPEFAIRHYQKDSDDKNDIVRVAWERHRNGANYTFSDGHARWRPLAQTLNPDNYSYGDRFYPGWAPYNTDACQN